MISFGCTAGVPPSFLNSAIAGDRIYPLRRDRRPPASRPAAHPGL